MKKIIQNLKRLIYILPYVFVFIASLYQPKDPDLGWHLKYGEYFFKYHQILRNNIFSTMMPNYHWANGSWGTDLITYFIYNHWGFLGLTIAASLVVTLTFLFFAKAGKLTFLQQAVFFPILIFLENSMNSNSFRGQQISLLFIGIIFFLLSKYKPLSKMIFIMPIIFLLWCNLHEESFLGLALFGLWIGFTIIKNMFEDYKKNTKLFYKESTFLIIIFVMTVLVTLINPFGWNIHLIALSHLGNPLLQNVNEYIPFTVYSISWWCLVSITVLVILGIIYLFIKKNSLKNLPFWGIVLILLLISFFIKRYVWPGYYLSFIFLGIIWQSFKPYLKKYHLPIGLIISLASISSILYLKIPFSEFSNMNWQTYCQIQGVPCSPASAQFLNDNKLTKNLFSFYDWGGWLIWNYPEIKPSIDGRMHVWQDKNGYSATAEYYSYWSAEKNIDKSEFNIVYLPQDRSPLYFELSNLVKQNKWKSVYQDDDAIIVMRIKNK